MREWSRQQTGDRSSNQLQSNIAQALSPVLKNPLVNGRLLENVALTTGDNNVFHGLNRKLQGWVLVRKRAAAEVFDKQDQNTSPSLSLILNASADVTVNLYVF